MSSTAQDNAPTHDAETEEELVHNPAGDYLRLIGPAYARNKDFWISIVYSSIPQGLFLGLVALAFFNFFQVLAENTWLNHEYELALEGGHHEEEEEGGKARYLSEDPIEILRIGNGQWWYVGLLAGAGGCVGLTKVIWTCLFPAHPFPDKAPSMLQELKDLRAHDPWIAIPVLICSGLSLGLGASVGPEAAMGCTGTSVGAIVARRWEWLQRVICKKSNENETTTVEEEAVTNSATMSAKLNKVAPYLFPDLSNEEQMCSLDGMAAAFGALFPAQYLSPMLLHEIGFLWESTTNTYHFMETVIRTGIASSVAYAVFVGLKDRTFLEQTILPAAAYDVLPTIKIVHMFQAAVLGIICGFLGLFGLLCLGVFGILGAKLTSFFDMIGTTMSLPPRFLGMLMTPVVGGTLLGLLAVACPLTLGDGVHQLGSVVKLGKELGADDLLATMFAKIACVSISLGFGFVGGQMFPLMFAGVCLGTVATIWIPEVHPVVAIPSCFVAVPCAFLPALFTMTTTVSMVFALGGAATTPVFVACLCSYTTICGLGLIHDILEKAVGGKPEASEPEADVNPEEPAQDKASAEKMLDEEEAQAKPTPEEETEVAAAVVP